MPYIRRIWVIDWDFFVFGKHLDLGFDVKHRMDHQFQHTSRIKLVVSWTASDFFTPRNGQINEHLEEWTH